MMQLTMILFFTNVICQFCLNQFAMNILQSTPKIGLFNKTVISNFFSDGPIIFKKCHNPMIFRELLMGGFGILMFQKCRVCIILTFKAFPIKSICFTIQGLNTHIHPQTHPNLTNIHTHYCYALKLSWDNSGQKRYNRDTNRHPATSQTPKKAV